MEVVAGDLPFQRRNVVEWSHRDRLTGALERARRETNHWSASTATAIHNYGKVVDHRALNMADGRVQQTQRKQLEVFSTQVPGGSLQVIRSSTTSSSRSSVQFTQMSGGTWASVPDVDSGFGDLQLSLHPLDLSSEKTKASVGRSIGWRRPPTRAPRGKPQPDAANEKHVEITVEEDDDKPSDGAPIISFPSDDDSSDRTTSASVISAVTRHSIAESRKSCSSENLSKVADAEAADGGVNGFLGRSSVLRRSLQYTRPPDFPTGSGASVSVRRMREEIEARGVQVGGQVGGQVGAAPAPAAPQPPSAVPKEETLDKVKRLVSDSIATQNHSFVTVKSLAEVRGRLRSKAVDAKPANGEDADAAPQSYVFGVKDVKDAKDKMVNGGGVKSEEWYRRRKSYGFEPDLPPQNQELISLKESKEDSWSDSGSTFKTTAAFSVSPLLKHLDTIKRSKDAANQIARPASLYDKADSAVEEAPRLEDADKAPKKTVVKLVGEDSDMDRRRDLLRRRAERNGRNLTEPVSVSIPVVANDAVTVKAEPALIINGFHYDDDAKEDKRHSIAVVDMEEAVRDKLGHSAYLSDSAEDAAVAKNKKRVEFSKTEVHFAAEPGRFNLVSTDDKPPPTNIVRGRRRQKLLAEQRIAMNRSGLPEVRFGDEQKAADDDKPAKPTGVITVTMEGKLSPDASERLQQHPLAKNAAKDDGVVRCTVSADPDNVVPMWRSTVTLKSNSFANANERKSDGEAEFQRLLKSLRPTGKRGISSVEPVPEITVTTSRSPTVRPKGFSTTVNVGPPETNGVDRDPVAFVSQHTVSRGASEQKSALHSLKLNLSPQGRFTPSPELGSPRLPGLHAAVDACDSRDSREKASYRHHASKAERLVQQDAAPAAPTLERLARLEPPRVSSPNSVYVVPEQRRSGFTAVLEPRSDFRTPSPVLPKSFSLVDSVARKTDPQRDAGLAERTVSVRELLTRMAKAENKVDAMVDAQAKKERIIEVVAAATDSASESDAPAPHWKRYSEAERAERVNGGLPVTDSVIFGDYRPTSPADVTLTSTRRLQPLGRASVKDLLKEGGAVRALGRSTVVDVAKDEGASPRVRQPRQPSPLVPQVELLEGRELLHSRAQPGGLGHHVDEVERFLRSERDHHDHHHDERRPRSRADDRARRPRSRSRDAENHRLRELERRSPGLREIERNSPDKERLREIERRGPEKDRLREIERRSPDKDRLREIERRSPDKDRLREIERRSPEKDRLREVDRRSPDKLFSEHGDARRRRSREELCVKEGRRRSRSRDELLDVVADREKRSRSRDPQRSRSRSQDELEVDRRHRSRSRDELEAHREPQHRSHSRDEHRDRERSADAESKQRRSSTFETSNHRQRSRSRDDQKREAGGRNREHGDGVNGDVEDKSRRLADKLEARLEAKVTSGDRKRPEANAAREERRHCKCAHRSDPRDKEAKNRGTAAERSRTHDKACLRAEGRPRAERAGDKDKDKAEKVVRKTRSHVAAMASPIASLVTKPSRRQNDSKKSGDIHIVIEPIRPVRRAVAPAKQSSGSVSSPHSKAPAKAVLSQKRSAGTVSDSNSSLSQGRAAGNHLSVSEATRPARRNHRKHTIDS
ncbi:uncharacterized protein LOC117645125 isoform X2 [Thrips palmi]|uniref:Uncharacterized protein LOC117645125 isoform X2 n=1 Tax=Thrips palmi TaxID=161013 RepID=A0A6P8YM18_THRPL|nr:uncharacterized protein LOC117645125 isoform X2 [Thrips palmi]